MNYSQKSNIYKTVEIRCAKTRDSILVVFGLMLVVILVAISLLLSPRIVVGTSMYPTLNSKETNDVVYILKEKKYCRGDIVVLEKNNTQSNSDVIKRVIGTEGDKISVKQDGEGLYRIYVNNKVYIENYIANQSDMYNVYLDFNSYLNRFHIQTDYITVGEGEVFVLGDNRSLGGSYDSLDYGPRKVSEIEGRVFIIIPERNNFFGLKIIW